MWQGYKSQRLRGRKVLSFGFRVRGSGSKVSGFEVLGTRRRRTTSRGSRPMRAPAPPRPRRTALSAPAKNVLFYINMYIYMIFIGLHGGLRRFRSPSRGSRPMRAPAPPRPRRTALSAPAKNVLFYINMYIYIYIYIYVYDIYWTTRWTTKVSFPISGQSTHARPRASAPPSHRAISS